MRLFLYAAIIFICGMKIQAAEKPNVLFLFTDDQRPDCVGALGHPVLQTPHLDSLVKRGFTLTNNYCLGANSGAVCLPSRNMLLSGRAYFRFKGMAEPTKPHLPGSFKKAGYETYHHGKIGNTARLIHKEFDHSKYLQPNDDAERRNGEPGKQVVDDAIGFLKQRTSDKPFLMYLAFGNPHDPRVAAEKYLKMYDRSKIPLPKNYMPYHPFNNGELFVRDERLAPWPRTEDEVRKQLHEYFAVITAMDGHIGRLLAHLEETGAMKNTIVVFSSDHGLAMGSHGLFGKQSIYEHSMKAPLIVAGPGVPHGKSDAMTYLLDIFPTLCDLSGVEMPENIDGKSFAPVIRGKATTHRDRIFLSYQGVQRSIRIGNWKCIRYPQINKTQLFDLATDPDELHDLAGEAKHADRITMMLTTLKEEQKHYGDMQPLEVAKPKDGTVTLETFKKAPKTTPKKKKN
ncbi:MAG: sulfatase-like hydrolase/transferase [Zavarzinella sp.]